VNDLIRNKTGSTDRASNSGHFILALRERTKTLAVVFFTAQRYASTVFAVVGVSIRPPQASIVYRNDRTNRAGFWHGSFLSPICCVTGKFGYLKK